MRNSDLDEEQLKTIFREQIEPRFAANGPAIETPKLTIVGGQQGSGKTTIVNQLMTEADNKPSTQRVVVDDLLYFVPGYPEAARQDVLAAQRNVGDAPDMLGEALLTHAFENRHDIILELANPSALDSFYFEATEHGYHIDLRLVATRQADSWTGVLNRFDRSLDDENSLIHFFEKEQHDKTYSEWPNAVLQAERSHMIDEISVIRRDNELLFENKRGEKKTSINWLYPVGAYEVFMLERNRGMTSSEDKYLQEAWAKLITSRRLANNRATKDLHLADDWKAIQQTASFFNILQPSPHNTSEQADKWLKNMRSDMIKHLQADNRIQDDESHQRVWKLTDAISTRANEQIQENNNNHANTDNLSLADMNDRRDQQNTKARKFMS